MTQEKALDQIRKLLALARDAGASEAEAATAAGKAQALMDQYRIETAMLEQSQPESEPQEEIQTWQDPMDKNGATLPAWKGYLAIVISKANGCFVHKNGGSLYITGRASDATACRELYGFCVGQTDHMAKHYAGNGRVWLNNWRHGVVDTIKARLKEASEQARAKALLEAGPQSTALILVQNALVAVDGRAAEASRLAHKNLHLGRAGRSSYRSDFSARSQGRTDGHRVSLSAHKQIKG